MRVCLLKLPNDDCVTVHAVSLLRALVAIGPHPRAALRRVWELIKVLTADLRSRIEANAKAIAEGKQPSPTVPRAAADCRRAMLSC